MKTSEASVTKGGSRYTNPTPTGRQRAIQATKTHIVVERWYVVLTTPDGFTLKLNYDPDTAHEVAKHFGYTKVKARVVSERVSVRR